ncbi:hypothetical protein BMJ21_31450 [Sinorhizobium medicae]|nr:hypothetical protein BMJ22_32840 [Sinorhizobium medicae]PLU61428.1 hypothetical protein BMJ21_31450 [Sinorhizobium medicae]
MDCIRQAYTLWNTQKDVTSPPSVNRGFSLIPFRMVTYKAKSFARFSGDRFLDIGFPGIWKSVLRAADDAVRANQFGVQIDCDQTLKDRERDEHPTAFVC